MDSPTTRIGAARIFNRVLGVAEPNKSDAGCCGAYRNVNWSSRMECRGRVSAEDLIST